MCFELIYRTWTYNIKICYFIRNFFDAEVLKEIFALNDFFKAKMISYAFGNVVHN